MHRLLLAATLVVVCLCSLTGPALAADPLTLSDVSAKPVFTKAGAHQPFDVKFTVGGLGDPTAGDPLRDLTMDLPAGQLGAITAATECSFSDLQKDTCPASSQLGGVKIDTLINIYIKESDGSRSQITSKPAQTGVFGSIYRAPTRGAEPARLGIVVIPALCVPTVDPLCENPSFKGPPLLLEAVVTARTGGDGGLSATVKDIPRTIPLSTDGLYEADQAIQTMRIRLNAISGAGKAFMTNPTTCTPATTKLTITTLGGRSASASPSFTPTDCQDVPFTPALDFASSATGSDQTTQTTVTVKLPYSDDPLTTAQTQPKTAVVALPKGFELSPTVGSAGLEGCTDEQFARTSTAPSNCPAGAQIGDVRFSSPLIDAPIDGKVFLAVPQPGGPAFRIFIVAEQSGAPDALRIKLAGDAAPDPATGQVTATLTDIPPLAFTTFRLTFRGGDQAVFATPRSCGDYTATSTFTPHSGNAPASPSSTVTLNGDCPDPAAFTPSASITTSPNLAGSFSPITASIVRPDRQARLSAMKMSMPPGLLGKLPGVPKCPLDAARAGACGDDSRVGTVTVLAGAGAAPLEVKGPVYVTPSIDGSFAGLAIVVPAKVGPIDLGTTVTLARLVVRPADQGLDVYADGIPLRQSGVAFSIRSLQLSLDRPGFTVTPSSCAALPVSASFTSDLGGTGTSNSTYQADGCGALPFAPKMQATLKGTRAQVAADGHPTFEAVVTQSPGQAGMSSVGVTLPVGIATDPVALGAACKEAQFAADACPAAATVGTAKATTPLLDTPLEGKVVFVAKAGRGLPDLRVQLRGELSVDLLGTVSVARNGQLITEFAGVPDVPISTFTLQVTGGARGLLVANKDMCTAAPKLATTFRAHSGATSSGTVPLAVESCSAVGALRISSLAKGRPSARLTLDGAGRKLSTARLSMPAGLTLSTRRVSKLIRVSASGLPKGSRARVRVTKSQLTVTFPRGGAKKATVSLRPGALRVAKKLRTKTRPRLAFRLRVTQPGLSRAVTSTLRTRPGA